MPYHDRRPEYAPRPYSDPHQLSHALYGPVYTDGDSGHAPARDPGRRKPPRAGCCCLSLQSARVCDLAGAVMSACLFVLVCVYWVMKPEQTVQIWDENIMLLNNGSVTNFVQASIADYCPGAPGKPRADEYVLQQSGFNYNEDSKIVVPLALHKYTLVVWPYLGAVFLFSFLFQAPRTWHTLRLCAGADADADARGDADAIVREEQPDFERWAEYALTSPFQVFVVATSFWIGEMDLLLCMCALQGALMFMGYALELELDVVLTRLYAPGADTRVESYEWFRASQAEFTGTPTYVWYDLVPTPTSKNTNARERRYLMPSPWARGVLLGRAIFMFFAACFFHGVVWWVIIHRFYSQAYNAERCQNPMPDQIKTLVEAIVLIEFALFTCFGVVVLWQLLRVLNKVYAQKLPSESERQDFHAQLWLQATACYHFLSFAAKAMLGILFVMLVERMPSATNTQIAMTEVALLTATNTPTV